MRPYFLLGSRLTYDMASKKVEDINLFKLDEITTNWLVLE